MGQSCPFFFERLRLDLHIKTLHSEITRCYCIKDTWKLYFLKISLYFDRPYMFIVREPIWVVKIVFPVLLLLNSFVRLCVTVLYIIFYLKFLSIVHCVLGNFDDLTDHKGVEILFLIPLFRISRCAKCVCF